MTALFWEQLVQEAEARGFYLCGVTASCSLLHTLSDRTYNPSEAISTVQHLLLHSA